MGIWRIFRLCKDFIRFDKYSLAPAYRECAREKTEALSMEFQSQADHVGHRRFIPSPLAHGVAVLFLGGFAALVQAQATPDAGSLLRDTEKNLEGAKLPPVVPSVVPQAPVATPSPGVTVLVKGFSLKGVTLVPEAELQAVLAPWVGKETSFTELRRAADAVSEAYRARGYLVRAYLPQQDLKDGIVVIAVLEGRLGAVRVDRVNGAAHLSEAQARQYMLARQQLGEPVRPDDLQRAISLLNDTPGVSASSVLEPGQRESESLLAVSLRDTPALSGSAMFDNAGAKATGDYRLTGNLAFNSPLGIGDQAQASVNSSGASTFGRAAYSLPLGFDGWRLGASISNLDYQYTLNGSKFGGDAQDYGLNLSYPIVRGNAFNLSVAAAYDWKDFRNAVRGIEINNKSISVTNLSLSGDSLDGLFGGGFNQFSLGYSSGRLDLSANTADLAADQALGAPHRHGSFQKVTWSLARLQRLTMADSLALSLSGQQANRNMDSAEKFVAAGPSGVRAYASTEASGDNGTLLSVEWRHQYSESLQALAFYDTANVKVDHDANSASPAVNRFNLSGAGFGVNWGKASELAIRASVAWRLGNNPARNPVTGQDADNTKRDPRIWIAAVKTF